ncbi:helix-turn-helix transcriptional regulator (plasmid) [Streptomyces sp. NBC_00715]|uniref:helix-turn-helix transcriptional regulator n=1 Tax=Streptomyces sp. NBC_00715 TaxID=2975811 RepID=UPI00386F34FC
MTVYRKAMREGAIRATDPVPDCLLQLGLLVPAGTGDESLVAVPPDVAAAVASGPIEASISAQQWALSLLRGAIGSATETYRSHVREAEIPVRLIRGRDVITELIHAAATNCAQELIVALPGGLRHMDGIGNIAPIYPEVAKRGVRQRTLHQHTARTHGPTMQFIDAHAAAGVEFRMIDEVFNQLVVIDRSIAFVPDQRDESTSTALLIEHPGLIHYLASGFDDVWIRAERVDQISVHNRPATATVRHSILRLLVDGRTDQVIARRLGLSPRTVANHIKAVADEFGSRSRAQLGYQLASFDVLATRNGCDSDEPHSCSRSTAAAER